MSTDIDDVFLDVDEFATTHTIDGQANILCVIDDKSSPNQIDGVYVVRRQLFVKQETLGYRPIPGQKMSIDNEYFYIVDCIGEGLLEVILEANRS
nr:hypothetical protein [Sporomusa silvacetica]